MLLVLYSTVEQYLLDFAHTFDRQDASKVRSHKVIVYDIYI